MKKNIISICLLCLALWLPTVATAQLSVAPTPIFIDDRTNASTFFVSNRSEAPQEIRIETLFGYVVTDSLGNRSVSYEDPHELSSRDLSGMVRVFPRQFVLGGNQQRTIRVQVVPSGELEDGTYFTRLRVISEEAGREVEELAESVEEGELITRINYRFEQGFGMAYRRGNVETGVDVRTLRVVEEEEHISLVMEVGQLGNSPFSGSQHLQLLDNEEQVVVERRNTMGVTRDGFVRTRIPRDELPAGEYTAFVRIVSDRADINPRDLIQIDPVSFEQSIVIP